MVPACAARMRSHQAAPEKVDQEEQALHEPDLSSGSLGLAETSDSCMPENVLTAVAG